MELSIAIFRLFDSIGSHSFVVAANSIPRFQVLANQLLYRGAVC